MFRSVKGREGAFGKIESVVVVIVAVSVIIEERKLDCE